jgi:hypothetical protein
MTTKGRLQLDEAHRDDEVARLVRLAGTSGPIAAERLARVRTAVHGAWRDEFAARQARHWFEFHTQVSRRRKLVIWRQRARLL